jgi:hypothetical protein
MNTQENVQLIITIPAVDFYILTWIDAFLIDRKAQNLSPYTIEFYKDKLGLFARYCDSQMVKAGFLNQTIRKFPVFTGKIKSGCVKIILVVTNPM